MSVFFRHGSNAFLAGVITALLASLWHTGALFSHLHVVALGLVIFFAAEYVTHRFQFHHPPVGPAWLRRLQRRLHYQHHEEPDRLDLLFLPLWYAIPVILIYAGFYLWLSGDWKVTQALLLGNLSGLLYYEYVHYIAHLPVTPGTRWGRYMKKYHLWHHYKNEHYWYGVTNPFGDMLFGTYKAQAETDKSDTVRRLYRQ